jgi:hypothetical protein
MDAKFPGYLKEWSNFTTQFMAIYGHLWPLERGEPVIFWTDQVWGAGLKVVQRNTVQRLMQTPRMLHVWKKKQCPERKSDPDSLILELDDVKPTATHIMTAAAISFN